MAGVAILNAVAITNNAAVNNPSPAHTIGFIAALPKTLSPVPIAFIIAINPPPNAFMPPAALPEAPAPSKIFFWVDLPAPPPRPPIKPPSLSLKPFIEKPVNFLAISPKPDIILAMPFPCNAVYIFKAPIANTTTPVSCPNASAPESAIPKNLRSPPPRYAMPLNNIATGVNINANKSITPPNSLNASITGANTTPKTFITLKKPFAKLVTFFTIVGI